MAGAIGILFLAVQVMTIGPTATYRVLRHGDSTIGDHAVFPGRTFTASSTPQSWPERLTGMDPLVASSGSEESKLSDLVRDTDTIAFLVIIDGELRFESYGQGHGPTEISQLFSVSKSIVSLLVGSAIDDGLIASVDQPITDYLPELKSGFRLVTLRDLLRMTSGSTYVENDNPFGEHVRFNYTDRLEREILHIETSSPPGELFQYRSGDNAMLSLALDRALGEETITEYFQRRLWDPLGAETGGIWSLDRDGGMERSWCCLATTARDLARVGQLVLDGGRWRGTQVISEDWIGTSTTADLLTQDQLPDWFRESPLHSYGYQWWVVSADRRDVAAIGKDGQYLYVDPTRRAVVVRLGWSDGGLTTLQWIEVASQAIGLLDG